MIMTQMLILRKKICNFAFAIGAIILVGCSSDPSPELSIDSVSIYAEPDANNNSATSVDLVLVYNQELGKTIGQLTASKYFASAQQLLLDNPTLIDVWRWELVPGQIVDNFEPSQDKGDAFSGFVFANYLTPGAHRIKVGPDGVVKILLLKTDLKNLAMLNTHDVNTGTSATQLSPEGSGDSSQFPSPKTGPTSTKKAAPTTSQACSPQTTSSSCTKPNCSCQKTQTTKGTQASPCQQKKAPCTKPNCSCQTETSSTKCTPTSSDKSLAPCSGSLPTSKPSAPIKINPLSPPPTNCGNSKVKS